MKVEVNKYNGKEFEVIGQIELIDGKLKVSGPPAVHAIAKEPIWVAGGKWIGPNQPEEFLNALPKQYKSAYLRCSLPQ